MRCAALVLVALASPVFARPVTGLVFEDTNGDGRPTAGERGIANAVVAYDVKRFVETSVDGQFTIDVAETGNGIIWVRVPDGYVPGPAWARVPAPGDDAPVEIGLRPLANSLRTPISFVITADTHLATTMPFANDLGAVALDATALDPPPAFFTILGDITQQNEVEEFALVDAAVAGLGVPYVPVPGNHDWYDDGEAWFARYGPDNYSFDIDRVHFVVWNMSMTVEDITAYLGAELARVGPDMTIVAMTHAPPVPEILTRLRALGVDYVLTGHTHTNRAVDHGGLIELTTEPLLMGGLDLTPAGYRVATIDRAGVLSTYHRTVVDEPQVALIAPAHGSCVPPVGGSVIVAAELDAGTAMIDTRVDCATPIAMRYAGGWTWRADLPALAAGSHTLLVDARAVSGARVTRAVSFEVCRPPAIEMRDEHWPQIGGNAAHTNATANAIDPPLVQRWATTVGGHVLHAAPAIANGLAFVSATDLGDGTTGGVVAIDLATGRPRWRVATATPARGSPAVADGVVAIGQLDGTVLGLDVDTGELRWVYELGIGLPPEAASLFAAPAADGGDFFIGNQRHLAALASDTGAPRWHLDPVPDGTYSQSLAAVAVAESIAVGVFHRELGGVIAWDRTTGRELWRAEGSLATAINATPVIANETVYIVNGMTGVIALDLFSGAVHWAARLDPEGFDWGNATVGTPAISGDIIVVPTLYRDLVALDAKTGVELWRYAGAPGPLRTTHYRGAGEAAFEASPVIARDIVWAVDTSGRLSALELATGRVLWFVELETPVLAGLAVAGNVLVVASYDGSVRAFVSDPQPRNARVSPSCDVVSPSGCCDARGSSEWPTVLVAIAIYFLRPPRRRRRPA